MAASAAAAAWPLRLRLEGATRRLAISGAMSGPATPHFYLKPLLYININQACATLNYVSARLCLAKIQSDWDINLHNFLKPIPGQTLVKDYGAHAGKGRKKLKAALPSFCGPGRNFCSSRVPQVSPQLRDLGEDHMHDG